MFGRWCASEVLWSDSSVDVGAADPCGCKDTRVIDELDTVQAPENDHRGIRGSPCRKVGGINSPKSTCTSAQSRDNQQEELEPIGQLENHGTVAITEIWWDIACLECAVDGYKFLRRDRQGRRGV